MTKSSIPQRKVDQAAVLQALGLAIMEFPHLRVCQLLENAISTYRRAVGMNVPDDLFYIEDEQTVAALEWYVEHYGRSKT